MNKKIIIDVKPKIPILPKEIAHGNKNAISRSKIINKMNSFFGYEVVEKLKLWKSCITPFGIPVVPEV